MLRRYGTYRAAGEGRKRQFVISTEDRDRHNTVIRADAWDLDSFGGAAFYQHNSHTSDPDDALGPARVWREGSELIGEVDFEDADINPKAEKILKKIDNGTLKNASVGFIAHDGEYRGEGEDRHFVFTRAELTEFSVVGIPSNREAKVRKMESDEVDMTIKEISKEDVVARIDGDELLFHLSKLRSAENIEREIKTKKFNYLKLNSYA